MLGVIFIMNGGDIFTTGLQRVLLHTIFIYYIYIYYWNVTVETAKGLPDNRPDVVVVGKRIG